MGDAASREAELKRRHDILNNDIGIWLVKTWALINSAKTLQDARPEPSSNPDLTFEGLQEMECSKIPMMLKGMGMECLLKTVWLAKGNPMSKDGAIKNIPGVKSHDLLAMTRVVCPEDLLTYTEEVMLAKLAMNIESGRYPTIARALKPETRPDIRAETRTYMLDERGGEAFDEMCNRLHARIMELTSKSVAADDSQIS